MIQITIRPYTPDDMPQLTNLLKGVGWAAQYVDGQLKSVEKIHNSDEGEICVAVMNDQVVGYIQTQHYRWNRLSYLLGLVVSINHHRMGVGRKLVEHIEQTSHTRGNRGVYVDTPVDNAVAREFYQSVGFKESYIMPEYYEPGLDGVTYQKLLSTAQA